MRRLILVLLLVTAAIALLTDTGSRSAAAGSSPTAAEKRGECSISAVQAREVTISRTRPGVVDIRAWAYVPHPNKLVGRSCVLWVFVASELGAGNWQGEWGLHHQIERNVHWYPSYNFPVQCPHGTGMFRTRVVWEFPGGDIGVRKQGIERRGCRRSESRPVASP